MDRTREDIEQDKRIAQLSAQLEAATKHVDELQKELNGYDPLHESIQKAREYLARWFIDRANWITFK